MYDRLQPACTHFLKQIVIAAPVVLLCDDAAAAHLLPHHFSRLTALITASRIYRILYRTPTSAT